MTPQAPLCDRDTLFRISRPRRRSGAAPIRTPQVLTDPFAHLRAKTAAVRAMDPKEKQRQQRRAQLVARLELMKKQVGGG